MSYFYNKNAIYLIFEGEWGDNFFWKICDKKNKKYICVASFCGCFVPFYSIKVLFSTVKFIKLYTSIRVSFLVFLLCCLWTKEMDKYFVMLFFVSVLFIEVYFFLSCILFWCFQSIILADTSLLADFCFEILLRKSKIPGHIVSSC